MNRKGSEFVAIPFINFFALLKKYDGEFFTILESVFNKTNFVIEDKGEIIAVKEFRKHLMWYLKGIRNSAKLKQLSCKVNRNDTFRIKE